VANKEGSRDTKGGVCAWEGVGRGSGGILGRYRHSVRWKRCKKPWHTIKIKRAKTSKTMSAATGDTCGRHARPQSADWKVGKSVMAGGTQVKASVGKRQKGSRSPVAIHVTGMADTKARIGKKAKALKWMGDNVMQARKKHYKSSDARVDLATNRENRKNRADGTTVHSGTTVHITGGCSERGPSRGIGR
jgi:hypothetical protein